MSRGRDRLLGIEDRMTDSKRGGAAPVVAFGSLSGTGCRPRSRILTQRHGQGSGDFAIFLDGISHAEEEGPPKEGTLTPQAPPAFRATMVSPTTFILFRTIVIAFASVRQAILAEDGVDDLVEQHLLREKLLRPVSYPKSARMMSRVPVDTGVGSRTFESMVGEDRTYAVVGPVEDAAPQMIRLRAARPSRGTGRPRPAPEQPRR